VIASGGSSLHTAKAGTKALRLKQAASSRNHKSAAFDGRSNEVSMVRPMRNEPSDRSSERLEEIVMDSKIVKSKLLLSTAALLAGVSLATAQGMR